MIKFEDLVLPFVFTPNRTIEGGVNGKSFLFPAGVESEVTYEEYQAILNSSFSDELIRSRT